MRVSENYPGRLRLLLAASAAVLGILLLPAAASAAPGFLWQAPRDGALGSSAGRMDHPTGIAADPTSGHVYVLDHFSARIDEFDAWGEFVKSWGWGVATGAPEPQTCGPQATPPTVTCQKGISGSGPGQISSAGGIAVGDDGSVYVAETGRHRVQKFGPDGSFLLMFGMGVEQGPNHPGNVCTAANVAEGDTCGEGTKGGGPGQLSSDYFSDADILAIGPTGTIFVGDIGRVEEFEPDGSFKSQVTLPAEFVTASVAGLDVNSAGDLYLTTVDGCGGCAPEPDVMKFSSAGVLQLTLVTKGAPVGIGLDAHGNLYVAAEDRFVGNELIDRREVLEFAPSGSAIIPEGAGFASSKGSATQGVPLFTGLATNTVTASGGTDVYFSMTNTSTESKATAYGPAPDKWSPPEFPPEIKSQYTVSASSSEALLRAEINPRFWADTSFYVEYGTGKCSEGGCPARQPAPPRQLGAGIVSSPIVTSGVSLLGLSPRTTYHYRFVAQSGGGGPTKGVGPGEAEGAFTTPAAPSEPETNCSNQAFRFGPSAFLPDCRAYEMVSPIDKNGGDVTGICDIACYRTEINQSSENGEKFTYSSYKAFGDAKAGSYSNQYMATRGPDGWSTHGISPPFSSGLFSEPRFTYMAEPEFRAFTPDLSAGWILDVGLHTLTSDAREGHVNIYRWDSAGDALTALTTADPGNASIDYELEFQGGSADGNHAIFTGQAALTPNASTAPGSEGIGTGDQLYDYSGGQLYLVSVLPNGTASNAGSAGSKNPATGGRVLHGGDSLERAISNNGSRIYWSAGAGGRIFLRKNPTQPQSELNEGGKCTEAAKACTLSISGGLSHFWTANPTGSKALFSEGSELFLFEGKSPTLIAGGTLGVLGTSTNLSVIYFVSTEALAPGATAGKRNLYVDKGGSRTYIGRLSDLDVGQGKATFSAPFATSISPDRRATRVSTAGGTLAFMSTESLTGYDNTDANNGKADSEVFVYDADAHELHCVSCLSSGARPAGSELKEPYTHFGDASYDTGVWAGGWLNTSETSLYTPKALSADGNRLFFNSFVPLVSRDTNGVQDVYEWEAPGTGGCSTSSADYAPANGGCLYLVSTGESPEQSEFVDATADGSDVFFKTSSSIDARDPGLLDVYDARVGGGHPPPPVPQPPCLGDACQSVPSAPNDPTPSSASFKGAGNPTPGKPRQSCAARKAKGSSAKAKRQAKKANKRCKRANRRAGR